MRRIQPSTKEIARERIAVLFREAAALFPEDPQLADRYVELARTIAMKHKVRIPAALQRRFCKHCYRYLVPGTNCRVRLRPKMVVYYCLACKRFMRFPHREPR